MQHLSRAAEAAHERVYATSLKVTDVGPLERQLARLTKAGQKATAEGRADVFVKQRQALQTQIERARRPIPEGRETFISNYGTSSRGEDFADTFYAYVHHPEKLKAGWPQRYEVMDKYFGGG
jgi:hypothetical protein